MKHLNRGYPVTNLKIAISLVHLFSGSLSEECGHANGWKRFKTFKKHNLSILPRLKGGPSFHSDVGI